VERKEEPILTGIAIGIDVGLNHFYSDSDGETAANPRYLRKSEKALKRLHDRVSREEERFWQSEKSDRQVRKKALEGQQAA
jgi:putative transposase